MNEGGTCPFLDLLPYRVLLRYVDVVIPSMLESFPQCTRQNWKGLDSLVRSAMLLPETGRVRLILGEVRKPIDEAPTDAVDEEVDRHNSACRQAVELIC